MKNEPQLHVEIRDVTTGLWIWRLKNPFWEPGVDWEPLTTSTCVESGGEILVLDPQRPPAGVARAVRLERILRVQIIQGIFGS